MTEAASAMAIVLDDRQVIALSGPETLSFLQGLVTVDVEKLDPGAAAHGTLLTPQGKVQFDFLILRTGEESYLLDTPRATASDLTKRLMFYRLRAKVEIAAQTDLSVVSLPNGITGALPEGSSVFPDPRHESLGHRAFVAADARAALSDAGYTLGDVNHYHARRIAAGIPEALHDFAYGAAFPHDIALDQTGGVDFHKGCFVGQEVVSRMQHRGTARRRVVQVAIEGDPPEAGTALTLNGKGVGEMGSHAGAAGLAIIRLDRAADALTGTPLEAGETKLSVSLPAWADYALPTGAGSGESAA